MPNVGPEIDKNDINDDDTSALDASYNEAKNKDVTAKQLKDAADKLDKAIYLPAR